MSDTDSHEFSKKAKSVFFSSSIDNFLIMKIVVNLMVVLLIGVLVNAASADPDTFEFFKDLIEEPSTPIEHLCSMYRSVIGKTGQLEQIEKLKAEFLFRKRGFHRLDCYLKDVPSVGFLTSENVLFISCSILFFIVSYIVYKILRFALFYIVCAIFIFVLFAEAF